MHLSAKADYALRAAAELAASGGIFLKIEQVSRAQSVLEKFLADTLLELKRAGIVRSQRGYKGGYVLAQPPSQISLAKIVYAVDGSLLVNAQGEGPESVKYAGATQQLREVWSALRVSIDMVLETVTLADLARGELPKDVRKLVPNPRAQTRP